MQKLLALLMLATVLLSVSACGDRPDGQAEQFPPTVYDDIAGGSPAPATPYDEMVENGRVRDTDGILSDGENPGG